MSDTPINRTIRQTQINRITTNLVPVGATVSSSYAVSASWSPSAQAGIADFNTLLNKPALVSASTQIDYSGIQNKPTTIATASVALVAVTASYAPPAALPTGVVSSSAQATAWSVASASVATTASYAMNAAGGASDWNSVTGKPAGLVSSSTQVDYTGIQNKPTTIATASFVASASYAPTILPTGTVSSSAQVSYPAIQNIPTGILSGSAQLNLLANTSASFASRSLSASFAPTVLPTGVVSASAQVSFLSIANVPSGVVSASSQASTWNVASASLATTASHAEYAKQALSASWAPSSEGASTSWASVTGKPDGLVSSSAQINALSNVSASFALTASYAANGGGASDWTSLTGKPTGIVSSSVQVDYSGLQNKPTTIPTASYVLNAVSASFAPTILPSGVVSSSVQIISNLPNGTVSSSAQVNAILDADGVFSSSAQLPSGIVSSSGQLNLLANTSASYASRSLSASFAGSDWVAVNNKPVGLVSSSVQVVASLPTGVVSSSVQLPAGLVSSSLQVVASLPVGVVSSSGQLPAGLVSSSAQATTWTVATASVAVSSSYALSASWSPNSGGGASDWNSVTGKPTGLVSSSTQLPAGLVSSSAQLPTGILSSSAQFNALTNTSASFATSASWAPSAGGATSLNLQRTGSSAGTGINTLNFIGGGIAGVTISGATASINVTATGVTNAETASLAFTSSYASGTISFPNGLAVTGSISASAYSGSGAALTNVRAVNITNAPISGTLGKGATWYLPGIANATALGTVAVSTQTLRLWPFIAPSGTIRSISVLVTAGAAINSTASVAIYTDVEGDVYPSTLVTSSRIPLPSNAQQTVVITPTTLNAGQLYWIGFNANSGSTLRAIAVAGQSVLGTTAFSTSPDTHYTSASNWGSAGAFNPAWPVTMANGLSFGNNVNIPAVGLSFS